MNLFYYIFYRFAHCYRRLGILSPDLSAHNALCIIQLITILMLAFTCRKIFPQIVGRNSLLFDIIILCICPILHTIQWLKCRNMYDKLQEKWGNEPPKQRRIRKYLIIIYVILVLICSFCLSKCFFIVNVG